MRSGSKTERLRIKSVECEKQIQLREFGGVIRVTRKRRNEGPTVSCTPDEEYLDSKALWPLEHHKGGGGQKAAPLGQIIQI